MAGFASVKDVANPVVANPVGWLAVSPPFFVLAVANIAAMLPLCSLQARSLSALNAWNESSF